MYIYIYIISLLILVFIYLCIYLYSKHVKCPQNITRLRENHTVAGGGQLHRRDRRIAALEAPAPRRGAPGLKNGGVCRHLMGIYRGYNGD